MPDTSIARRPQTRGYAKKVVAHGELIWKLLERNPGGLSMEDITELTELTRAQVRKAFEWIRDIFAEQNDQPIIYIPGRHKNIYKLNVDPVESDEDLRRRIGTWALQIARARTAIAQPSMAKFGQEGEFKRLTRHMAVVEEDLTDLLNHVG